MSRRDRQREAVVNEYHAALEDGFTDLAERIRTNPDNQDIFDRVGPGERVGKERSQ